MIDWYVDDNKVSYVEKYVNTRIIEMIAEYFGEINVSRLKIQVFWNRHIFLRKW